MDHDLFPKKQWNMVEGEWIAWFLLVDKLNMEYDILLILFLSIFIIMDMFSHYFIIID